MLGLGLSEAATVDALDNAPSRRVIPQPLKSDNIASMVTPGLPIPCEIGPPGPDMIGKNQSLEFGPAEILEMDSLN